MKSLYELQSEEVEITGKIKQLEETASNEVDKRELKRLRKRAYEIQEDLTIARNKERLSHKETLLSNIHEAETRNKQAFEKLLELTREALPKLREVSNLIQEIALYEGKVVASRDYAEIDTKQLNTQFNESVRPKVMSIPIASAVDASGIARYIRALELLLKENEHGEVKDAKVSAV